MDCILKNIYLGSWRDCQNLLSKPDRSFWKIITVADDAKVIGDFHFPITDGGTSETDKKYFQEAVKATLMYYDLNRLNVLVHCQSGVNRSPSVVITVVAKIKGFNYIEAFDFVRSRRPHIWPCHQQALLTCEIADLAPPKKNWKGKTPPLNKTESIVNNMYKKYLKRTADPDGLKHYTEALLSGKINKHILERILMDSEEYKQKKEE